MHDFLELQKKNRPSVSQYGLRKRFPYLRDLADSQGLESLLRHLRVGAGIGYVIQVNDCETSGDWTESDDGVFDYAVAATGKRVGTNCLSLTATASTNGTQYVETKLINESAIVPTKSGRRQMDWRDTRYLGFWKHAESSAHFGADGELEFAIINDGKVNPISGTAQDPIDIDGTSTTVYHWCEIDLNSYDRDKVEAIRFYGNNTSVEVAYIDDIVRYDISVNNAPLYGCGFPIKSGTTLTKNETAQWTIDGLIAATSAANVADLGTVWMDGDASRTGTARRDIWAFVPGVYIVLVEISAGNTAGDLLEWASSKHYKDVTTTATGKGMFIGLEAGAAEGDWIFALATKVGTSA